MTVELDALRSIPYFEGLSQAELEAVRQLVFEKTADRNEVILLEGDPPGAIYFVMSGALKAFKTSPEGKEQILCILRPGDSFNDVAAFDGGPNPASVRAMSPVRLYGIAGPDMHDLMRRYPTIAINVVRDLAQKVRHFVTLVEDLSFRHVTERVARLLLEYATEPEGTEGGTRPRLTQQEMAAMVGSAREVVGRSLKALEEEGAIRMERHRIAIVDKETLKELASGEV
ncbi:MAG: Crp/Fnr family transcriptional regulator [Chloroflexi bacterium]|mgnify:CR=1 FL=1|nr:MAG: Crp/Fnr family transcriptional regulator [Chloroflexota bacterium]RLC95018.1 MAG: Crp/Fnr family transcriptional regulator [Chloroflexota bacterium]